MAGLLGAKPRRPSRIRRVPAQDQELAARHLLRQRLRQRQHGCQPGPVAVFRQRTLLTHGIRRFPALSALCTVQGRRPVAGQRQEGVRHLQRVCGHRHVLTRGRIPLHRVCREVPLHPYRRRGQLLERGIHRPERAADGQREQSGEDLLHL